MENDTICAIATAQGGAIGTIRVSGPEAISTVDKIFISKGKQLAYRQPNTVSFGTIIDSNGEIVDEVLVTIFRAPHSYTGEDSVEISCHGSTFILQKVIQLLIDNNCRQALPGEFTQRAFLNGKMDLSQAEAVADLIAAASAATHRMAINQMRGNYSTRLSQLREKLLKLTSLIELELDFSDHEELEFADRTELNNITDDIRQVLERLTASFALGNAIKNGVPVAIVGETNAGKSTLLNAIVGEERAIVSDIHGTTRDTIEDNINIEGTIFRFIDTAGIRETHDQIEAIGIERALKKIKEATIIVWVIDPTNNDTYNETAAKIMPLCQGKTLIAAINKTDMVSNKDVALIKERLNLPEQSIVICISAKQKQGIDQLKKLFIDTIKTKFDTTQDILVSNIRHYEALSKALEAITRVKEGLENQLTTDLIAQDLRDCLAMLSDITGGAITTEETLSNIFSHFCVGK